MNRLWRCTRNVAGSCSGRFLKRALLACLVAGTLAAAQTTQRPGTKKDTAHRANELSLAGLRPGKDTAKRADGLYRSWLKWPGIKNDQLVWGDNCRGQLLAIDLDSSQIIQVIRLGIGPQVGDCTFKKPTPWKTGRGLRVGDPATRTVDLYGEPESKSPSTRNGQPLELWYYAFDWAGPDVPQVMEVLCTREKEGQPGRVVEITLAAPSL